MEMLIKLFTIMSLLFVASCTVVSVHQRLEIKRIVTTFEKLCNCKVNVPISFATLKGNAIGTCYGFKGPNFLKSIDLDYGYWIRTNRFERESLIFHELGHCVLGRDHDALWLHDIGYPRPRSLMHPSAFFQYEYDRDYYLKELFNPAVTIPEKPIMLSLPGI